ncbi:MAG: class I SAM-dependent methyltransferase [Gemmatimonadetes bacterium]|nr:class I SAM-dependent methyltransferase [Gemmatimonadota bacterium]
MSFSDRAVPSMMDLVRLSRRPLFPPGGVDLYRQIAILTGMSEGDEVLDVACGNAVPLEWFVTEYGVHGSGVDADEERVAEAEARVRRRDLQGDLQLQQAPLDRLPYRDAIFDVAVGELGLTSRADPAAAVRELVRVTRPGGAVALIQLVWKAPVDAERSRVLADHLGVRPLMLVEWKRLMRAAGVERLHTEDWSDEETAFRPQVTKPFPDFAELFSLPEKLVILRRAWKRWGVGGVRTAVEREREVHRLLTHERILGLDLLMGVRAAAEPTAAGPGGQGPSDADPEDEGFAAGPPHAEGEEEGASSGTRGLPLFHGGPR